MRAADAARRLRAGGRDALPLRALRHGVLRGTSPLPAAAGLRRPQHPLRLGQGGSASLALARRRKRPSHPADHGNAPSATPESTLSMPVRCPETIGWRTGPVNKPRDRYDRRRQSPAPACTEAQAPGPGPRCSPDAALQPAHRRSVRGVDSPLHPLPWEAAPCRDGAGRDHALPDLAGRRREGHPPPRTRRSAPCCSSTATC